MEESIRKFFIFRHGETDWNREERFQGHTDIPINETGREQARALALRLEQFRPEALLSSDLSRARETAEIVASRLKLPVHLSPGLREANLGQAEGMTRREIEAKFGQELVTAWKSWRVSDADVSYPGGETGGAVIRRVFETLESFAEQLPHCSFGVATHGGVIRRVMQSLNPPGSKPVPIPNGVIYLLLLDPAGATVTERWSVGNLKA